MPAYDGVLVTYRYLRLAVVTVLVLLLAAVVVEWWHTGPSCWQDSVSAYFYMPVQSVLSASLLARGMGLANRYAAIAARRVHCRGWPRGCPAGDTARCGSRRS